MGLWQPGIKTLYTCHQIVKGKVSESLEKGGLAPLNQVAFKKTSQKTKE